jgi:phosphoribosylformylglycinamidine synthase
LHHEKRLQVFLRQVINDYLVPVAHDLADGGLATALLELAMASDLGLDINLEPLTAKALPDKHPLYGHLLLFGETTACALLALPPEMDAKLRSRADKAEIPLSYLGSLTSQKEVLMRQKSDGPALIYSNLPHLKGLWQKGLSPYFDLTHEES